jgi:hypothetical protein
MIAPNRYDELGPLTRPIVDRLINDLASSPSTSRAAALVAAYAVHNAGAGALNSLDAAIDFNDLDAAAAALLSARG